MKQLYYGILLALLVYLKFTDNQSKKDNIRMVALAGIVYILYQLFQTTEGLPDEGLLCGDLYCKGAGAMCLPSSPPNAKSLCFNADGDACKYLKTTNSDCSAIPARQCTIEPDK